MIRLLAVLTTFAALAGCYNQRYPGEREQLALRMLGDAGFGRVEVKRIPGDIINNYYVATRR